jgi:hypothetical protein
LNEYSRRLRIWETNYGRDAGWVIERQGQPIAVLTAPRLEEMFWDSYRMEILTDDPYLRQQLLTKEFWARAESERLVWRSREFGEVAPFAFPALSPFPEAGRLMMRGLFLPIGEPGPWDWLILWVRRWRKRRMGELWNSMRSAISGRPAKRSARGR